MLYIYKRNIIIKATAVLLRENFDANIPKTISAGVALRVLYKRSEFVIP